MCGIAGYVRRAGQVRVGAPEDADALAMARALAHRGPDGEGLWRQTTADGWEVALVHRRLAIIDLAGGGQPMANETGTLHITFNGEVYNFRELRAKLERLGHVFRTRSDTEAVLHHMEQCGPDGAAGLDGMFAFGLWDSRACSLLLARDRPGIKPLYYAPLPCGGLAFASELTALLRFPGVARTISPAALASFLFRDYVHPPATILAGVFKLEPGHTLTWTRAGLGRPQRYWTLGDADAAKSPRDESVEALTARVSSAADRAVESQMVADVPVGVFLSGGIDSSLVAALARRHVSGELVTFSIGFEDADFDESQYARLAADHLGTRHITRKVGEQEMLNSLDAALDCLDEPVGDPSILPTWILSQLASRHVKVALGGDGGDELFGGYPTYKAHRLARVFNAVPSLVRNGIIGPLVRRLPVRHGYQSLEWKLKRFVLRWDDDPIRRHQRWMSATDLPDVLAAVGIGASDRAEHFLHDAPGYGTSGDRLNRILAFDYSTYLPGSVLAKVDRASMAHGLEVRPPLLANEMVDLAFSLSSSLKLRGGSAKWLLKRVAEPLLPAAIVHRRKKGFAIPLARWISGPLLPRLQALMNDSPLWHNDLLRRQTFAVWLDEHCRKKCDRSKPLWSLMVLDHWARRLGAD